ncbi:3-hydroxyacyl-CoA dehydrogenase type-2-like [Gordionus sp. m RMFG-2023]|uniref:3-hydroxyacyl-CoA dehydrogenase type-2-like n=1 Tax=Gordionus sp. m RMFG-2023 TaxID=3053472 RepID=UPI0031FE244B
MLSNLKNVVALITGGSSGLGKSTAEYLIKQGCKGVVIFDLPTSKGKQVASELGKNCLFAPGDVRNVDDINQTLDLIKKEFNQLNALINCAGISVAYKTYNFHKNVAHSLEDFEKVLMVNTLGTFNVTRLAVGLMAQNKSQSINLSHTNNASKDFQPINPQIIYKQNYNKKPQPSSNLMTNINRHFSQQISDNGIHHEAKETNTEKMENTDAKIVEEKGVVIMTSASAALDYNGQSGQVAFAASKAAVAGMTIPLARDFSDNGIRVCTIAPGLYLSYPSKLKASRSVLRQRWQTIN